MRCVGSGSSLWEGQRGGEWGWVPSGLGGLRAEYLHLKAGERIGNYVMHSWDVLCGYAKTVPSSQKEQAAKQSHHVWAA